MSSSSSKPHPLIINTNDNINFSLPSPFDPNSSHTNYNTIFVHTDPSNFKTIVQKLTGADQQTLLSCPGQPTSEEIGHRRHLFKLQERRLLQSGRKLEIRLHNGDNLGVGSIPGSDLERVPFRGFVGDTMMVSPVSPLEMVLARGSLLTPSEEEDRVIAEKGFYLHPSPFLNTPCGYEPPVLLPLFPLSSPRDDDSSSSPKQ